MTREIVETILAIEKKAEQIVAAAKTEAQQVRLQTQKTLELNLEHHKKTLKSAQARAKAESALKSAQEAKKIEQKAEIALAELAKTAKKNLNKTKKNLVEYLLK